MRAPLKTIGVSLRTNLFGFAIGRLDYAIPFDRPAVGGLWTFSLGTGVLTAPTRGGRDAGCGGDEPPTAP